MPNPERSSQAPEQNAQSPDSKPCERSPSQRLDHAQVLNALAQIEQEERTRAGLDTARFFPTGKQTEQMALAEAEQHLEMRRRTRLDARQAEAQYELLQKKKPPLRLMAKITRAVGGIG